MGVMLPTGGPDATIRIVMSLGKEVSFEHSNLLSYPKRAAGFLKTLFPKRSAHHRSTS